MVSPAPHSPQGHAYRDLFLAGLLAIVALVGGDVFPTAVWDWYPRAWDAKVLVELDVVGFAIVVAILLGATLTVGNHLRSRTGGSGVSRMVTPLCGLMLAGGLALAGWGHAGDSRLLIEYGDFPAQSRAALRLGVMLAGCSCVVGLLATSVAPSRATSGRSTPLRLASLVLMAGASTFAVIWNPVPPADWYDEAVGAANYRFGNTLLASGGCAFGLLLFATIRGVRGAKAIPLAPESDAARAAAFVPAIMRLAYLAFLFVACGWLVEVVSITLDPTGTVEMHGAKFFPVFTVWISLAAVSLAVAASSSWVLRPGSSRPRYGIPRVPLILLAMGTLAFLVLAEAFPGRTVQPGSWVENVALTGPELRELIIGAARVLQLGVLLAGLLALHGVSARVGRASTRSSVQSGVLRVTTWVTSALILVGLCVTALVWIRGTHFEPPRGLQRKIAAFLAKDPATRERVTLVIDVFGPPVTDWDRDDLRKVLRQLDAGEATVLLNMDPSMSHGDVVRMIDEVMKNEIYDILYARAPAQSAGKIGIFVNGQWVGSIVGEPPPVPADHPALKRIIGIFPRNR